MKILFDINHPAHVHYFRNLITQLKLEGNEIVVTATFKNIAFELLKKFNIDFIDLGSYGNLIITRIINIFLIDFKLYKIARKFKPDLMVGFSSFRISHVSKLINCKNVILDDTEHSKYEHALFVPFSDTIITPSYYLKNLSKKQLRVNSFFELLYLHPKYFIPDPNVLKLLGIKKNEKYIILRFTSWEAFHDIGKKGLSNDSKMEIINYFSKKVKVFISSENELPVELKKYELNISIEKIHHVLYYATLLIGESGTMSTESAILGTPAIRISPFTSYNMGNFYKLQNDYDLLYSYIDYKDAIKKADTILSISNSQYIYNKKREKVLKDCIDLNEYILNLFKELI